jgi:hypothetical protein
MWNYTAVTACVWKVSKAQALKGPAAAVQEAFRMLAAANSALNWVPRMSELDFDILQ